MPINIDHNRGHQGAQAFAQHNPMWMTGGATHPDAARPDTQNTGGGVRLVLRRRRPIRRQGAAGAYR